MNRAPFTKSFPEKLAAELSLRKKKNKKYSLRAFAQFLGVPKSTVAGLLAGDRLPMKSTLQRIGRACGWPVHELTIMQEDLAEIRQRAAKMRRMPPLTSAENELLQDLLTLALRRWASRPGCTADPAKLARELGVTSERVKKSLEILERCKLVHRTNGRLVMSNLNFPLVDAEGSFGVRKYVTRILKAAVAHATNPKTAINRSIVSYLPMNPKDEQRMIRKVNTFIRTLHRDFPPEDGSRLYTVALSYFPFSPGDPHDD